MSELQPQRKPIICVGFTKAEYRAGLHPAFSIFDLGDRVIYATDEAVLAAEERLGPEEMEQVRRVSKSIAWNATGAMLARMHFEAQEVENQTS